MNKLERLAAAGILSIVPALGACRQNNITWYEVCVMDEDGNIRHVGGGAISDDRKINAGVASGRAITLDKKGKIVYTSENPPVYTPKTPSPSINPYTERKQESRIHTFEDKTGKGE